MEFTTGRVLAFIALLIVGSCISNEFSGPERVGVYGVPKGTTYGVMHDRVLGEHSPFECYAGQCKFIK